MFLRCILVLTLAILSSPRVLSETYSGLIVKGNYSRLPVVIKVNINDMVTYNEIKNAVEQSLLSNELKFTEANPNSKHYLKVEITIIENGSTFCTDVFLQKNTKFYAPNLPFLGGTIKPAQGDYKAVGTANRKYLIVGALEIALGSFLSDYVASNKAHIEDLRGSESLNVNDKFKSETVPGNQK